MTDKEAGPRRVHILRSIGPAIIIASVVLGPGSILTNSKVGWQFGYELIWVLAAAGILLTGMTAMSARLGVYLEGTLCEELARRAGRPWAVLAGGTLFLVAACFQFSNNLGVLYALEPLLDAPAEGGPSWWPVVVLILLNSAIIAALLGFRHLYIPVERLMKFLVALMVVGFAANLLLARPDILQVLFGLVPSLPDAAAETLLPIVVTNDDGGKAIDDKLWAVQGLIGTTFSVGAAFYQSYLVRQKGWTTGQLKQGLVDSVCGIAMLGLMSLMIMVTAASVLHGNPDVKQLTSAADVARQLQPLFGGFATGLFCMGIFAGAFSSFLVNAMIGGTVLSDGLGFGGSMDGWGPKICTVIGLAMGMVIAIATRSFGFNIGNLIVFAQALTVVGNPLLAAAMLWLATRPDLKQQTAVPTWMKILAVLGFLVVLALSIRTGVRLYLQVFAVA